MGKNQHQEPLPLLQDLKVTVKRFSIVFPIEKTERRSMFLSNIDQTLNFDVETIHFFPVNIDFPPDKIVEILEDAFRRLLVPYDFLAGRLRADRQTGRLEIDCNSAGAGFVVASSELSLSEIGDLVYPNPAFRQLVTSKSSTTGMEDQILFTLQVTSFKCGGFAMSISNNHILLDGISFKIFLENLASVVTNKHLAVPPYNDRHVLATRSPPRVTFSHPELHEIPPQQGEESTNAKVLHDTSENLEIKIFGLSNHDILKLKEKAQMGIKEGNSCNNKITSFNVVTAHVWRCKALSENIEEDNVEKKSTILYAVDLRHRLRPPLPLSYVGNAVILAYGSATLRELKEGPLAYLVQMVSEGAMRITDEYARSVIDWGELHKGFPYGDVLVSSWWKLGFADVVYPWGKPISTCPLVHHRKDIILFFPDNEGGADKGVNVLVALPIKEMERFEDLFHKFLA